MIDRISPTVRPMQSPCGYQKWRDLLFMHWPLPVSRLRPHVPARLDLDCFDGIAYLGVVPFRMVDVRPAWWPESCAFRFLETNVRTYVVHGGQPGVYFFSLEAASRLAVWGARWLWGLPYFAADMTMRRRGDEICYESRRKGSGAMHKVRYRPGSLLGDLPPRSIEFFLLERYLLFVERHGGVYVGQVHHRPYPAQSAEILEVHDELIESAGLGPVRGPPTFAHFAAGVDVEVYPLRPV